MHFREERPEITEFFRHWRDSKIRLDLRALLIRFGSFQEPFEMIAQGEPFIVTPP